jgi:hypothetical protein
MFLRTWEKDGERTPEGDPACEWAYEWGPTKVRTKEDDTLVLIPRRGGTLGERVVLDAGYKVEFQGFSVRVIGQRGGKVWDMLLTPIPTPDGDSDMRS